MLPPVAPNPPPVEPTASTIPGHYGEEVACVPVKKGDVVWDAPEQWTPCL